MMDLQNGPTLEVITERPDKGSKPVPLLFVHGMCHAAWCWQENFLPWFAGHGYSAHAVSLRGHGKSECDKPLRSVKLADYVADIERVVTELEQPPVLIGHSLGGMVVQKYLEKHDLPAAVLLGSVPPQGALAATFRYALRNPLNFLRINATRSLYPLFNTPQRSRELMFSTHMPREQVEKYASLMQEESYRAYWDAVLLDLPRPEKVNTPLLVLGAENDALISKEECRATARAYHTQEEIFPDMAHDMMLERDWENVAALILLWLNTNFSRI